MPPPDESTSLLPEARPLNWRQKCYKFSYWSCCFVYFLLLLADVALSISVSTDMFELYKFKDNANFWTYQIDFSEDNRCEAIALNVIDTLICWIFLIIVARSPRFVGCFTIIKSLIRLPRFWNLVFLLVLYILGTVQVLLLHFYFDATIPGPSSDLLVAEAVMELLNVFTKLALVGALNHVQVQNVAHSGFSYKLLKRTLMVTWVSQFCVLIGTIANFNLGLYSAGLSAKKALMELLLLPFVTRTTELIWTKIFQDNKCIIGKYESNSFTRQNPRISNAIEAIIWTKKYLNAKL